MTSHSSTTVIPAAPAAIADLLASPGDLPGWNPALTRASGGRKTPAAAGDTVSVTVLRVLRGTLEYLEVTPERVAMDIRVPGLREESEWTMEQAEGGTRVTHTLTQTGNLAGAIAHQAAVVPSLRLARLKEQIRPTTPSA